MSKIADQLAKSLLQKDTLDQCSVYELKQLVNQYPFFGPVQLLLAEKLKSGQSSDYESQFKKTLLYFNNPLWYSYMENESGYVEILPVKKVEIKEAESKEQIPVFQPTTNRESETQTIIENPLFKMEKPGKAGSDLAFEPYHTVDYFASQGIRFKEEEKPTDRFGQQLKSFTDWLKTMKRLPQPETVTDTQITTETNIGQLAVHSIEDRDVITEAMAEVWEKQGNIEKAIAIYHKLSLHNPAKSPYFATKIEQLKKSN